MFPVLVHEEDEVLPEENESEEAAMPTGFRRVAMAKKSTHGAHQ